MQLAFQLSCLFFGLLAIATRQSSAAYNGNDIKCIEEPSLPSKALTWHHHKGVASTNGTETRVQEWEFLMWSEASQKISKERKAKATYWWSTRYVNMMLVLEDFYLDKKNRSMSESIFEITWKTKGNGLAPVKQFFSFKEGVDWHKECTIKVPNANYDFTLDVYVDAHH